MKGIVRRRRGGFTLVVVLVVLLLLAGLAAGFLFARKAAPAPAPPNADEKPAPVERPIDRERPR